MSWRRRGNGVPRQCRTAAVVWVAVGGVVVVGMAAVVVVVVRWCRWWVVAGAVATATATPEELRCGSQTLLVTPNYVQRLCDMWTNPSFRLDWPPIPSTSPYPLRVDGPKEARWVPGMSSGALFHSQTC